MAKIDAVDGAHHAAARRAAPGARERASGIGLGQAASVDNRGSMSPPSLRASRKVSAPRRRAGRRRDGRRPSLLDRRRARGRPARRRGSAARSGSPAADARGSAATPSIGTSSSRRAREVGRGVHQPHRVGMARARASRARSARHSTMRPAYITAIIDAEIGDDADVVRDDDGREPELAAAGRASCRAPGAARSRRARSPARRR